MDMLLYWITYYKKAPFFAQSSSVCQLFVDQHFVIYYYLEVINSVDQHLSTNIFKIIIYFAGAFKPFW